MASRLSLKGRKGEAMKKSRFSEEQIAYALRLAESGTPVVDVCRQIGVSEATYYTWKKKYADLGSTILSAWSRHATRSGPATGWSPR